MKHSIPFCFTLVAALMLSACSITKSHEKDAKAQAAQAGLVAVAKPRLDAVYQAPGIKLHSYKKLNIANLDFSQVKVISPTSPPFFDQKWELDDKDRAYYQERFATATKRELLDSNVFVPSNESAADTLVLRAKVLNISPLASKDDLKSRPTLMDVYSEGFGRMTVAFEFYDSMTNKLVFALTDEHELGRIWEKNNRVQNAMQVRLAFDYWLSAVKRQWETLPD
jgi:hypothetical protein